MPIIAALAKDTRKCTACCNVLVSLENLIKGDFIIDLLVFYSLNFTVKRIITLKVSISPPPPKKYKWKLEKEKQHKMKRLILKQLSLGAFFHLIHLCDVSKIDEQQGKYGEQGRDGHLLSLRRYKV